MDTKLIDIFVSYARADCVQVESWVKRLRQGGVGVWFDEARDNGARKKRISARTAAQRCEVLVWFVSKFGTVSPEAGSIAAYASGNGKAVLIVALDTVPVPKVFDLSLPKAAVVDLFLLGRAATWEAILKGVRDQGVPWIDPSRRRRPSSRPNRRRSSTAGALLGASVVSFIILALLLWPRLKRENLVADAPHTPMAEAPHAPVAAASSPPMAVAVPAPTPAVVHAPEPAIPVEVPPALEDSKSKRAIEYVTRCIGAAAREQGLTPERIDAIAAFFADPVRVEGMGLQPASAIKASLQSRQREWPKWKETIHFIEAEETPDPACREVVVQLSYAGESSAKDITRGVLRQHYIVDFTNEQKPNISKLWIDDPKRQP